MSAIAPSRRPAPRAVLFDAYGTLFDVYSVGLLAEQLFPGHGERLAQIWRDKQIEYTRLLSMSGRYRPFWELTRAGLRFAAARLICTSPTRCSAIAAAASASPIPKSTRCRPAPSSRLP